MKSVLGGLQCPASGRREVGAHGGQGQSVLQCSGRRGQDDNFQVIQHLQLLCSDLALMVEPIRVPSITRRLHLICHPHPPAGTQAGHLGCGDERLHSIRVQACRGQDRTGQDRTALLMMASGRMRAG